MGVLKRIFRLYDGIPFRSTLRPKHSACGSVAGIETRKGNRQDQGQKRSTKTKPRKTAFQAVCLLFPVTHLPEQGEFVLFGLLQCLARRVGRIDLPPI